MSRPVGPCRQAWALWDDQSTAGMARHICLHHCPVLDACRQWAAGFEWAECVVAGVAWPAIGKTRHLPRKRQPVMSTPCAQCEQRAQVAA